MVLKPILVKFFGTIMLVLSDSQIFNPTLEMFTWHEGFCWRSNID